MRFLKPAHLVSLVLVSLKSVSVILMGLFFFFSKTILSLCHSIVSYPNSLPFFFSYLRCACPFLLRSSCLHGCARESENSKILFGFFLKELLSLAFCWFLLFPFLCLCTRTPEFHIGPFQVIFPFSGEGSIVCWLIVWEGQQDKDWVETAALMWVVLWWPSLTLFVCLFSF